MKISSFVAAMAFSLAAHISLNAQPQAYLGYPSPDGKIDIRAGFAHPPKGYGNVPFYWWSGDSLRIDRLADQLEILSGSATEGFAVSYNHTHAKVDTAVNAAGHGFCGVPEYSTPAAFSEEWWKIWNEFSGMCADKGMGAGMDDYVFAWPGNRDFRDRVEHETRFQGYQGRMKTMTVALKDRLPDHTLCSVPQGGDSLFVVYTVPSHELHPEFGKGIVEGYFKPFEDHMDARGLRGMNYFFQDELVYEAGLDSWCEDMPQEFMARKGYDIVPLLPLLFGPGRDSVKVRLDYAEVVTQLAEERFFKPIYDWNASKGLIYGCDNMGRGLDPKEYMDYFRAVSWFTAPGNDAPSRGSSFTQTKVSSSIAHLYGRPRTWLEAFHSMGWDANGAVLTHQLDHHIIAGGNLLCMHGLYYSTHGGWWEWAPPCFHFRMPYWEHMKLWLEYAQRMCFVLSQGRHVCDVAVLYPTETIQAIPGSKPTLTFQVADELSRHGYDYDFIDYQSLRNAVISDAKISVAGENYKVLVLADAMAMHESTVKAIEAFKAAGGIVVALGGRCPELSYDGVSLLDKADVVPFLKDAIVPDFAAQSGEGRVLHHRVADQDVYMVMDVAKGDSLFFRSHGRVERWDAKDGSITEMGALSKDADGTWLRFHGEKGNSMLVVFSPGETRMAVADDAGPKVLSSVPVTGAWDVEILPTMNNRWGDFRLPASDEMIGVEARAMRYAFVPVTGKLSAAAAESVSSLAAAEAVYGYGPYMMTADVDSTADFAALAAEQGASARWTPYEWSWDFGVFDSPGSQGYHGLKGKVDEKFLILDRGCHQLFRTKVYAPETGKYRMVCEGVAPDCVKVDGEDVNRGRVRLARGWHDLFVAYASTQRQEYALSRLVSSTLDRRQRSMVMFYPMSAELPQEKKPYGPVVTSRWQGSGHLEYDAFGGADGLWVYAFETAPGTRSMSFDVAGKVSQIFVDGRELSSEMEGSFDVDIPGHGSGISTVIVVAESGSEPGCAFFKAPVRMQCRGGRMPAGDWTLQGAMKWYSGGVKYTKTLRIEDPQQRYVLDLGDVDATCELAVNGRKVDVLLTRPYAADITDWVRAGDNVIEVLVYSSLSNHYQTIPTPYKGKAHAGLIGPVVLRQETATGPEAF